MAVRPCKLQVKSALAGVATLCALGLLSGCDNVGESLGLTGQVQRVSPAPITSERLEVMLPKAGARAVLAPVARREGVTVLQTLDGITLSFDRGVLTATRGLGEDLMSSDVSGTLKMVKLGSGGEFYRVIRSYLDGEDQTRFPAYQCRKEHETKQQVEIGDDALTLTRLEEVCVSPDHRYTNTYWVDDTGDIVKSQQWVSSGVGDMVTERVMR
ncbi:hypothetical protein DZK27_09045 [Rhodobacteraceae bacterium 63075]|nr:hypothetical protein DZK27_09045 [Rhodobacteraceae bacterium 63075]